MGSILQYFISEYNISYYCPKFYEFSFYPLKGSAKALPMGSIWYSYGLLSLVNEKWSYNLSMVIRRKIRPKTFIVRVVGGEWWVVSGGWVDGSQKGPSIFLKFKYVNK